MSADHEPDTNPFHEQLRINDPSHRVLHENHLVQEFAGGWPSDQRPLRHRLLDMLATHLVTILVLVVLVAGMMLLQGSSS